MSGETKFSIILIKNLYEKETLLLTRTFNIFPQIYKI